MIYLSDILIPCALVMAALVIGLAIGDRARETRSNTHVVCPHDGSEPARVRNLWCCRPDPYTALCWSIDKPVAAGWWEK